LALWMMAGCGGTSSSDPTPAPKDSGQQDSGRDDTALAPDSESDAPADGGEGGESGPTECALRPKCDAPLPPLGDPRPFKHTGSKLAVATGSPRHRGHDMFVKPGDKQWLIGKFAYGPEDKDLEDEEVDIYLLRGCGSSWKKIGTWSTSDSSQPTTLHADEDGISDTGGRIYLDFSSLSGVKPLEVGRHRLRMVVGGDLSGTDQYFEVLPGGAKIVVSDIDGTLTTSETAAWTDIFGGTPPDANAGAADTLTTLAKRGFFVWYLSARPSWLGQKTHDWLDLRAFPPGLVRITDNFAGATGAPAATFKTAELVALQKGVAIVPSYGFGNTSTDVDAYDNAAIAPAANRYFFKLDGDLKGGTRFDDYTKLVAPFTLLPTACP
jgi:hypothetical protein